MSPEKAKPGDTVTFAYIPADKNLASREAFNLYVYSYSKELPKVQAVELKKSGKKWTGNYTIDKEAYGLVAKIKLDRENDDNNQGKGYIFALYTPEGKVLPGHKAGLALAYTSWGQLVGINQDLNEALRLTEEEFLANPATKKEFVNSYLRLLQATKKEGWEQKTKDFLEEVSALPDLDDSTLVTLYRFYAQTGNQEKAMAMAEQAQKNPKGEFFQIQAVMQLQGIQAPKQRLEFVKKFQEEFPDSKYTESIIGMITQSLFQEKKLEEANNFLQDNRLKAQPYYFYAVANQANQEGQAPLALKALDNGISLMNEHLANPDKYKPAYYTKEEWQEEMKTSLSAMMLSLKGNLLWKQGQLNEAVNSLRQAYEASNGEQSGISMDYARVLLENKNYEPAIQVLEATARKGFTGSDLMDLLKQAYAGARGSDSGWEEYRVKLETGATEALRSELQKKMVEQPAPAFELKDLEGKVVKLANYQGKVVILDFWATWCGPCLGSFPGMKKLVEEYQKDPSVAFVFVNTWQDEANKEQVVKEFLEKNQYPFYVLMDTEDKVVASYGVSGIPTKFVIDPKGKIRFKSIGFEGDTEKMVKEVKLMIELARGK
ncbi:MAG: Thiol:disulfide oxidoreductase related to ResA [Candidatus Saccharicenans subterraneus]|uniref:Thiol:disulfide oxidoreductase related to ResA n=1 Tax=Candidatus Saccharicenans subterraneus TaxID=2508984 RepID=A0A3E2BK33_9BACT|nr:MAG: Thiol:disulfide oxidoreductase related to ResA [Candidatus Saccharicenans subterraneum]